MSNTLWFKRKRYGWGWTPCNTKGWVTVVAYIVVVFLLAQNIEEKVLSRRELMNEFFLPLAGATLVLLAISYKKGEVPRWQWGKTREDSNATVEQSDERKDVYEKEQDKDETPHDEHRS